MDIESQNIENINVNGKLERLSGSYGKLEGGKLNEGIDSYGYELREFGIQECKDAAKEIFTPEVLENWGKLSIEQRQQLASKYADGVAESFQLTDYRGVQFEEMEPNLNGYNQGDGIAHLSNRLIDSQESPLQIVDTLTHELRHQYQMESIQGKHYVPEETRREWAAGAENYTSDTPWADDPWGYKYNPLELDARYAGESVVRELTKDYINGNYA